MSNGFCLSIIIMFKYKIKYCFDLLISLIYFPKNNINTVDLIAMAYL